MKEINNKKICELSWIQRGGVAIHYYEPETIEELITLVSTLQNNNEKFDLVGLTSNIYFKNTYNVENLISTKRLTTCSDEGDSLYAECGVNVARLSREMVKQGIKGFEGLIDLPGTVGGGIYGNSGCYGCLLSDLLIKAEVLLPDGTVKVYEKKDIEFGWRTSDFKSGKKNGIILGIYLKKEAGNLDELELRSQLNHENRKNNQPGPKYNLGTTYCSLGERTAYGKFLGKVSGLYDRMLRLRKVDEKTRLNKRNFFELRLAGGKSAIPYLYHLQRFMWYDEGADKAFIDYQRALRRIFISPGLEIEIYE